jgi:glycosyltransferase involved in cell wall biosynthesis
MLVLLAEADLVLSVLLKAMATRLPVVSTDMGAIANMVAHGITGLIVSPATRTSWPAPLGHCSPTWRCARLWDNVAANACGATSVPPPT